MTQVIPPLSMLARAVAAGAQPPDLMPELHREVLTATGGTVSVLLQQPPADGPYGAVSGSMHDLSGEWLTAAEGADLTSRVGVAPGVLDLASTPTLAKRLAANRALVVALSAARRPSFLVVASPAAAPDAVTLAGARARLDFGVALELTRLGREGAFHQRTRDFALAFSRGITSTVALGTALETLTEQFNALVGTRRTSVWIHDRRARELALAGSSDPVHLAAAAPIVVDDPRAPAARGLRLESPQLLTERTEPVLIAPLRGWRRALGTIVIEGASPVLDGEQMHDLVQALAGQLSVAIENVQLLKEIQRQRRLLEDTFNSLVDLVVVTDNHLRVVQTNDAFAARAGGSRHLLLDRSLDELVGRDMRAWAATPSEADAHQGRTGQFDDEVLGGTFAATLTPLISHEGHPVGRVLVARDITEQTRLEAERTALRERLAQSEKLASLGQFVAGIAHEINNPLQGVLGHLELLIETSEEARPLRPTLRRIYQEADRAAKIVRNLLVFTGSRRMARRKIKIDRVISRVVSSRTAATRRAGIQIVHEHAPLLPSITGDPLLLQQAFLNVLINAEHAIGGKGGQIEIHTTLTEEGGRIRTTIRDTGTGIAPDVLPRIFDPFFTTKDVGKGTGLGLAITYGIVQEHGGTIRAANSPAGGAIFTIELPASPA